MATIGDVLRHLVANSPGTEAMGNRQELYDAIDAEFPPPEPPEAELTPEEQAAQEQKDAQAARIAELEADLAALRAGAPAGG